MHNKPIQNKGKAYCRWDTTSELNIRYHDTEWGVPLHDDRGQFEFLKMEVMQCGLNRNMMIQKQEIFCSCFDNFAYDKREIERIMNTEGMIRSGRKIEAVINNAQCFQKIREEFGTFRNISGLIPAGRPFCIINTEKDMFRSTMDYLTELVKT